MAIASVKDIPLGSMISFRSKNPNDSVDWKGTLISVCTYPGIRPYMDPRSYNEAVRQVTPSVPSDVTLLTYFLITVDNDATVPTVSAFADEWLESGSLNIINTGNKVTIQVEDPNNDPGAIISILASAHYASKIIS